ncbi:hypothetical protein O181_021697 [Austropuccinia psidii MF-1]|uniref:Uncharacterized protein n=1 Tax=Austropuccinia psidii MF-1 TaxID=1389203 RepID=A0A9Q3CG07_9BASI|nr:hypothetical protein [Austropuccinia psidii MF-1]
MHDSFEYAKERWDKSHNKCDFNVGDLVLLSTLSFDKIKGPNKLKASLGGPFMLRALHGPNAVQLKFTGELRKKHPAFPVSLIKTYSSSDKDLLPLRDKPPLEISSSRRRRRKENCKSPQRK